MEEVVEGRQVEEIYEELKMWTKVALKEYLQRRCLPLYGDINVLIARVFNAIEKKIPTELEGEERLRACQQQYDDILERLQIEDPLKLDKGWIDESQGGTALWPDLSSFHLLQWHTKQRPPTTNQDSLPMYKIDKAYQYFKGNLAQNVAYHPVSDRSEICVLLNLCTRSMERSKEPHEAWVALRKENAEILGAYCSCAAGLSEVCNHVTALLFRIESVVKEGGNVGTSNLCSWKPPSKETSLTRVDVPIEDTLAGWNRSTYTRESKYDNNSKSFL